jgi:hypothetical protein
VRTRALLVLFLLAPTACSQALPPSGPVEAERIGPGAPSALYHGCSVFTPNDDYGEVVTHAPADPKSSDYIASVIQAGDRAGFFASTGVEQVNLADDATPKLKVHAKVEYHPFPVPYPWQPGFFIEPLADHHAMVVQYQACHLYEAYGTSYLSDSLSAFSGANWDLSKRFVPLPSGHPSAMASGLPLFAGIVRWEDYQAHCICHALDWSGIAHTVSHYGYVRPASDTDRLTFNGSSSYELPYGARLRLKASFSTAGWGPQATMVADAMKHYGIYLADTGSDVNGLYFANANDGTDPWNAVDLVVLSRIHLGDFEVLKLPRIRYVSGQ